MTPEKMQKMRAAMGEMRSMMGDAPAEVKGKMEAAMSAMEEWMASQGNGGGKERQNMLGMRMK